MSKNYITIPAPAYITTKEQAECLAKFILICNGNCTKVYMMYCFLETVEMLEERFWRDDV